jgi:prefoldin subunit 4
VTWSDQEKINQFSRLNTRQTEAQYQLEVTREEKEQIDEVYEEVEMLELNESDEEEEDDDDLDEGDGDKDSEEKKKGSTVEGAQGGRTLPFKIGDAFVYVTLEKGMKLLEQEKERLEKEMQRWEEQVSICETGMKSLKVELYAKFGSNISE